MRPVLRSVAAIATILATCMLGTEPTSAAPRPEQDEERRLVSDRLNITLGGFRPDFTTDLAAGFGGPLGAFINVERTLGLDEDLGVFVLTGQYRFRPRHAIEWVYTALDRSGTANVFDEITFGDPPQQFTAGALVQSKFDSTLFAVNYRYSFVNNGKLDAGISAGLFTYAYDIALVGEAFLVGDDPMLTEVQEAATRVIAPLPAFGIFIDYALRKNVVFRGCVRALDIKVRDFTGKYMESRFTLEWYFYKHLGIGIGSSATSIDFRNASPDDPFRVTYDYSGYLAYLSIVF